MKKLVLAVGLTMALTGSAMANATMTAVMGALNSASTVNETLKDAGVDVGSVIGGKSEEFNSAEKLANSIWMPDSEANVTKETSEYGKEMLYRSQAFYGGCQLVRRNLTQSDVDVLTRGEGRHYLHDFAEGTKYGIDKDHDCDSGGRAWYHFALADAMEDAGK